MALSGGKRGQGCRKNWVLGSDRLGLNLGAAIHRPGDLFEPAVPICKTWVVVTHPSCRVVVGPKCNHVWEVLGAHY